LFYLLHSTTENSPSRHTLTPIHVAATRPIILRSRLYHLGPCIIERPITACLVDLPLLLTYHRHHYLTIKSLRCRHLCQKYPIMVGKGKVHRRLPWIIPHTGRVV